MNILLEEGSFVLEMDQPVQVNVEEEPQEQLQENYEEDHFEIFSLSSGPYRFLRNCSNAGVWMCALYNLCVILLLISVYVYRRMK